MSDNAVAEVVDTVDPEPVSKRTAPLVVLVVAVAMLGLLWILIGAPSGEAVNGSSPLMGKPAPNVRTTTIDGEPFELGRRRGSWVFLNFFQADCVGCVEEHPELVAFVDQQRALGSNGAEFYSVVWNDTQSDVKQFFAERGGDWPIVLDEDADIAVAFGVAKVPETWLINPDGIVVYRILGATTSSQLARLLLDEQIKARAGS
jgi:cytochrome c biogenesis protein CcmG, thiol:disulfide interchange protein DsbE